MAEKGALDMVSYQENHRLCLAPQTLDVLLVIDL